ncbi:MAG: SGNH/GDSL hydrolase family protein [Angelakisella sp.]
MKREILCYGDSNTHGYNAETLGGRLPYEARWTGILAERLGADFHIIEEGLNGRTTVFDDPTRESANGLTTLHPIMMTHEPLDTMIIMLGTNDTKDRFNASAKVCGMGLKRLVEKALTVPAWRDGKPDIIIVAPAPISPNIQDEGMGRECSQRSYGLAEEYRKVAELLHCRFLDAAPIAEVHPNDWIHLTRASHVALAEALWKMLR